MVRTRGQREQEHSPLPDLDLDPFQSNIDRFQPVGDRTSPSSSGVLVNQPDLGSLFEGTLTPLSATHQLAFPAMDFQSFISVEPHWAQQTDAPSVSNGAISNLTGNLNPFRIMSPAAVRTNSALPSSSRSSFNPFHTENSTASSQRSQYLVPTPIPSRPVSPRAAFANQFHQYPPGYYGWPRFEGIRGPADAHYAQVPYPARQIDMPENPFMRQRRGLKPEDQKPEKFSDSEKLTEGGSNFYAWCDMQVNMMKSKSWYAFVTGATPRPDPDVDYYEYELWERIDALVKSQIGLNMAFSLFHQLNLRCTTSAELWMAVMTRFERRCRMSKANADRQLRTKMIQPGESMSAHLTELRKLKDRLFDNGGTIDEEDWFTLIVASLSEHPDWRREMGTADSCEDAEQFIAKLEGLEAQGYAGKNKSEAAFNARHTNSKRTDRQTGRKTRSLCPHCKRGYHAMTDCWAPGGGGVQKRPANYRVPADFADKERANLTARIEELEQERAQLTQQRTNLDPNNSRTPASHTNSENESVKLVLTDLAFPNPDELVMLASKGEIPITGSSWLLDSGASSHMTNNRTNFSTYQQIHPIVIQTAKQGETLNVVGIGSILALFSFEGRTTRVRIQNVLHVPQLTHNLISLAKLAMCEYEFRSTRNKCYISRQNVLFGEGNLTQNQWVLDLEVVNEQANIVTTKRDASQTILAWHRRLAHIGMDRIRQLSNDGSVLGLIIERCNEQEKCEPCLLGKMTASSAVSRELRATAPGDLSDRKSVTGFVFLVNGGPVDWQSKKQSVVAKSTAEAEYIAVSTCATEAIWLRHFYDEIHQSLNDKPLDIHVDNDPAIKIADEPIYLSKTKHIDIQVHHIRDEVAKRRIRLLQIPSKLNPADILTKPLHVSDHQNCLSLLGME